jgi:hypothetical protein
MSRLSISASWLAPNPEFPYSEQPITVFASVTEDTGVPVIGLQASAFLAGILVGVEHPVMLPILTTFAGHTQRHAAGTYSFLLRPSSGEGDPGIFVQDVLLLVVSVRGAGHQAQATCLAKYDRDQRLP